MIYQLINDLLINKSFIKKLFFIIQFLLFSIFIFSIIPSEYFAKQLNHLISLINHLDYLRYIPLKLII